MRPNIRPSGLTARSIGGTLLLQPGQRSYTVLGQLYGEFVLTDSIRASVGRRAFDTPYINGNDSRMTPNTFEAYAVQGTLGGAGGEPAWHFGAGYVDKIKPRNGDDFVSMATSAGAPAGVERGVYVAGVNYQLQEFTVGAIDYNSADIINIAYTEARYALPISQALKLLLAAQYSGERSTGDDLLRNRPFAGNQSAVKVELAFPRVLLSAAYAGTGSGSTLQSPWGGYPGFTSVQIQNFYRAGEDSRMLRAAFTFPRIRGLSAYALWVHGSCPTALRTYAQDEYDSSLQWKAGSGPLKGLSLRARFAHVDQHGGGSPHQNEIRLAMYYEPPSL